MTFLPSKAPDPKPPDPGLPDPSHPPRPHRLHHPHQRRPPCLSWRRSHRCRTASISTHRHRWPKPKTQLWKGQTALGQVCHTWRLPSPPARHTRCSLQEPTHRNPYRWQASTFRPAPGECGTRTRNFGLGAGNSGKRTELCNTKAKNGFINPTLGGYLSYTPWDTSSWLLWGEVWVGLFFVQSTKYRTPCGAPCMRRANTLPHCGVPSKPRTNPTSSSPWIRLKTASEQAAKDETARFAAKEAKATEKAQPP